MLRLRTFGTLVLEGDSGPVTGAAAQRRSLALLALLALGRDKGMSRDKLVAYLWPESDAEHAHHGLAQLLHALRRDLREPELVTGSTELRLNQKLVWSDLEEFEAALARDDPERAASAYGGPFLDGFYLPGAPEFERLVETERARLAKRLGAALESLAQTATRGGDHAAAAAWWGRLAAVDPFSSRVTLELMRALAAAGDRAGAVQHARDYERRVRDELHAAPDPSVTALAEQLRRAPARPPARADTPVASVAVLPFASLGPEPDTEYLSDGITEQLINALTRLRGFRVPARTSVLAFKGAPGDVREVGRRLNVGLVVEGSVQKAQDRIRVSVQLINASDGYHVWSETYERDTQDIFTLEDDLARAIAGKLARTVAGEQPARLVEPATSSLPAYLLYLRGQRYIGKRTEDGFHRALKFFDLAVETDPAYALAYAAMASAYVQFGFDEHHGPRQSECMLKAKEAALKALGIDKTLAESRATLGCVRLFYDWDWAAAEQEFRAALELNPGSASAHHWYGLYLAAMGRAEESFASLRRALELDPLNPAIPTDLGRAYYLARRVEEATSLLRHTLELDAGSLVAQFEFGRVLALSGRVDQAQALCRETDAVAPQSVRPLLLKGYMAAASGRVDQARRAIEAVGRFCREGYLPAYDLAGIEVCLGDADRAITYLSDAVEQRSGQVVFANVDPMLDRLRPDVRFRKLLARMGFRPATC